jgi:hypothetical protein
MCFVGAGAAQTLAGNPGGHGGNGSDAGNGGAHGAGHGECLPMTPGLVSISVRPFEDDGFMGGVSSAAPHGSHCSTHLADGKDARMTNPNLTLIAALLDRSGSMKDCKRATETGFDEMIAKHRSEPGEAVVTLSTFDDQYDNVYANVPIADVPPLTLVPRNMTAMLDAIGRFITEIGEHLAGQDEADRPGTVICLIMTDGYENASKEWSYDSVKTLITQQREQYNWSFLFLGANIDAVDVGSRIGVPKAMAMTYNSNDSAAVSTTYTRAAREMARRRSGLEMSFSDEDRRAASRDSKKN